MRPLSLLLASLSFTALVAQVRMPATTQADLAVLQGIAQGVPDARRLTDITQGSWPTAYIHGRCMVGFLAQVSLDFDPAAVDQQHVRLGARKGDVLSLRIDAQHLDLAAQLPGIRYLELAGKVAPHLDRLVKATRADSVQRGIDLPATYTGRDVLIGVLDWGFDYSHPMFMDTALTATRIHAAWDQFRQAGPGPEGFGYGTELASPEEFVSVGTDTVNIYSYATHGTHVAGIAGGSGAGTAYRGVAFDAEFLFCTFLVDAAAVLDAFEWMNIKALEADKRLVVNMSWGLYYIGTLDGNSLISQVIDAYAADGVAFANSGGNNGDVNFHIRKDFAGDTLATRVQFYPYSAHPSMWGQSLSMWGAPGEGFATSFQLQNGQGGVVQETPWYATATQEAYLDSFLVHGTDTVRFNLTTEAAHPLNQRPHFRLRVANRTSLRVVLKATAPSGVVHFWNVTELSNGVGNWGQAFLAGAPGLTAGDAGYGISEPACTEGLVTVAAYLSEFVTGGGTTAGGTLAGFSSHGPTLDGRMKPDLAAPGVNVASSISSYTDNSYTALSSVSFNGRTYPFARFSGTSMASPAVAGIMALLLEAAPEATPAEIKEVLRLTARTDAHTGVIPEEGSTRWGQGKVNAYHAVAELLGVTSVPEQAAAGLLVWPNPTQDRVHLQLDRPGTVLITLRDAMGRTLQAEQRTAKPWMVVDLAPWPSGVYLLEVQGPNGRTITRVVRR